MADTQFIILDDQEPQETGLLTDFDDVRNAILNMNRQDAVTVLQINPVIGLCRNVNADAAREWFDNHIDFGEINDPSELPAFLQIEIGDAEINALWDEYQMGARAYA